MSLLLNTAAASAKLHLWHLQKKCHLKAARTPSMCLKRWKTIEQQPAMVRYHGNVFDLVQERSSRYILKHPLLSLYPKSHDNILAPLIKQNSCLFYSHGWLKMVVSMEEQPLPPPAPTCCYRDDTLYWNMRNPANTVAMTTQPEDNCFTAYNTTHHLGCFRNTLLFFALYGSGEMLW